MVGSWSKGVDAVELEANLAAPFLDRFVAHSPDACFWMIDVVLDVVGARCIATLEDLIRVETLTWEEKGKGPRARNGTSQTQPGSGRVRTWRGLR